ncbi:MAG: hypothetical protein HUU43_14790 [Ignavibacteriaceae bacterium]|nr:hypothetical protein [Ignavibacteriaceae bacterium]
MEDNMNSRSEYVPKNRLVRWLIVIGAGTAFFYLLDFVTGSYIFIPMQTLQGWNAETLSVIRGEGYGWNQLLSASEFLISLIIVFLIIPYIFYRSFGAWVGNSSGKSEEINLNRAYTGLALTSVYLLALAIFPWKVLIQSSDIFTSQTNKIRKEYYRQALDIALQEKGLYLRNMASGDINSLQGVTDSVINSAEPGKYLRVTGFPERFHKNDAGPHIKSYLLRRTETDTIWHLTAISDVMGSDPVFINANGKRGLIQRTLEITPSGQRILYLPGS